MDELFMDDTAFTCLKGIDCFIRSCAWRLSGSLNDWMFDNNESLDFESKYVCGKITRKQ